MLRVHYSKFNAGSGAVAMTTPVPSPGRPDEPAVGGSLLADAARALSQASEMDSDLCGPFVSAFGVTGAAVMTLGKPLGSETLCATGVDAARYSEIQLDLGEGPGWEALASHRPVLHSNIQHGRSASWPLAWQSFREAGVGALFAFPLAVAGIDVGAITLHVSSAASLTEAQVSDATHLARILSRQVLRRSLFAFSKLEGESAGWNANFSRREVHQATGMVLAQMHVTPDDALLVLRGHAFATSRPVRDVAADVIARTLNFTPPIDERI